MECNFRKPVLKTEMIVLKHLNVNNYQLQMISFRVISTLGHFSSAIIKSVDRDNWNNLPRIKN